MSNISRYLKMNSAELEEEITRQNKKISSAKETISLLKKLQIAANSTSQKNKVPTYTKGDELNG